MLNQLLEDKGISWNCKCAQKELGSREYIGLKISLLSKSHQI